MDNNDSLLTSEIDTTHDIQTETEVQVEQTPVPARKRAPRTQKVEGPKRHLKKVKDSLASIRKPSLKRLGRRAGIKRFSSGFFDRIRVELNDQLRVFMKECYILTEGNRKKTVNSDCVRHVFKRMGRPLYVSHH